MEQEAETSRELGGLRHQPPGDREGRARRHRDLDHGACPGLVEMREPLSLGQHRVGILDELVRRQPALRLAEVHRAP